VLTRFHMSLILLCTAFSGLVFSKLFLISGLHSMVIRYIVVLIFAYLCFFLLMKLWLIYLTTPYRKSAAREDFTDAIDIVPDIPGSSSSDSSQGIKGQDGDFGGGGASGSWEAGEESATVAASEGLMAAAEPAAGAAAEGAGDLASGVTEEGGLILIPLAAVLVIILGGGVYLIYEAPVILSEAAFEFVLATSLVNRARTMDSPNWIGSVFRSTWPAFLFTAAVVIIFGFAAMSYCPQATKLAEVARFCF